VLLETTGALDTTKVTDLTTAQTLTNKTLTSPKIGTSILDTNGNELLKVTATGSAVNELTLENSATGKFPTLKATGGDTDISIIEEGKGTGSVIINLASSQQGEMINGQISPWSHQMILQLLLKHWRAMIHPPMILYI